MTKKSFDHKPIFVAWVLMEGGNEDSQGGTCYSEISLEWQIICVLCNERCLSNDAEDEIILFKTFH